MTSEIMKVKEMINTAFGNLDTNTVNFKLMQTVLYLLARQLRILERRVEVIVPPGLIETSSSFKVTEVKIHTKKKKPKKPGDSGPSSSSKTTESSSKSTAEKSSKKEGEKEKEVKGRKPGEDQIESDTEKKGGKKAKKGTEAKSHKGRKSEAYHTLEELEMMTEKELRVIHQRADSFDQPDECPTPMASAAHLEDHYEKLLVVERTPSGRPIPKGGQSPKISLVTQEEFLKLTTLVNELQAKFGPIGSADFPENAQLMEELRKNASLTDAMAALQLSARLEATEKALGHIIGIVTEIAVNTPGVELDEETRNILGFGATSKSGMVSHGVSAVSQGSMKAKKSKSRMKPPIIPTAAPSLESMKVEVMSSGPGGTKSQAEETALTDADGNKYVTYSDLDKAIQNMFTEVMAKITGVATRTTTNAEQAFKMVTNIENKLDASLNVGNKMAQLENLVGVYSEQINALDTGLSSQMTNYQEQLTQMQHDLEAGIEAMNENLANSGGDPVAVAELNNSFLNLQMDFETMTYRQKDLQDTQTSLGADLSSLWKQIEMLRDTKSDRDEVADALRDKAGIGELNGLVSLEQFNAVRGDLEKRIVASYDKFNNQEIVWQKAIDDLLRELSEKADIIQVLSMKDEISKYLRLIKKRMQIISDIVGEPKAAITSKKIFRDTACISCSTPAGMEMKTQMIPALSKFPGGKKSADDADYKSKIKGDGDHKICYPGLPIPHPRDPRAHICQRYCGGSHTLIPSGVPRVPPATIITHLNKAVITDSDEEGEVHEEEVRPRIPCIPCNKHLKYPRPPSPVLHTLGKDIMLAPATSQADIANNQTEPAPTPPLNDNLDVL